VFELGAFTGAEEVGNGLLGGSLCILGRGQVSFSGIDCGLRGVAIGLGGVDRVLSGGNGIGGGQNIILGRGQVGLRGVDIRLRGIAVGGCRVQSSLGGITAGLGVVHGGLSGGLVSLCRGHSVLCGIP